MGDVEFNTAEFRTPTGSQQSIAYSLTGQGDDTVYLLHGVTANHRVWAPIQQALSQRYRVVSIDQRGHGNSGKPSGAYQARDYSDDIHALVTLLGGRGKNVLVGHSLGSRNAVVAAAMYPSLIDGIVGIDFTPFIEPEVFDALEARVSAGNQRFSSVAEIESYLLNRYPNMPAPAISRRAQYGYQKNDGTYIPLADPDAMRLTVQGLREDLAEYLSVLTVPSLLVRGAESKLVTEKAFSLTKDLRPDLQYVLVPGADHYVPEAKPTAVGDLVTEYISTL